MNLLDYTTQLVAVRSGFDGKTCWVNPWMGLCPDRRTAVLTAQQLQLSGSDLFFGACNALTNDQGATWSKFEPIPPMQRVTVESGKLEACVNDLKPQWHAASGTMLGIGLRVYYQANASKPDHVFPGGRSPETVCAVWDYAQHNWSAPQQLAFRDVVDRPDLMIAGSTQRIEETNGDILLPMSCCKYGEKVRATRAARCVLSDDQLVVVEIGNPLSVPVGRGLLEPSLTKTAVGRYLLTMRNEQAAYVAASNDGLHFCDPRMWRFDDGELLGSCNTQQHWISHGDELFLVYTRHGLNNDHVFRHRAPLLIAQVDPDDLVVVRSTERELVPNRGARLGNFSVCEVSRQETWVLVAEWMQPAGCERYGSDNTLWIARINWAESS